MDIIRRNTDYALRAMVYLARHYGNGPVSTKIIAEDQAFSYQLACKLMQKLSKAGLVKSCMGINGGYTLTRTPAHIDLSEVIETIQGPLSLSKCLLGVDTCCNSTNCQIRDKLGELQDQIGDFLGGTTLADLVKAKGA